MRDAFLQASRTLVANRLRSALGALAIAVAVATQVLVTTALDGVAASAEETTARAFGSETFLLAQIAAPGRVSREQFLDQLRRNPPITRSDWRFLERVADGTVRYAPNVSTVANVAAGGRTFDNAGVSGTTSDLAVMRDLEVERGRFLTFDDDERGTLVAVIGADVADALYPGVDPLGQTIRIAGRGFQVVGLQRRQGTANGTSLDRFVWIPISAWERAFGAPRTLPLFVRATPDVGAQQAEDHARVSMRARRQLLPAEADNFDILTPDAARGFVASLTSRIGLAAGPISLMALLAAIVVVTNTVLVSVTQRTREIGVRRALGATRTTVVREVLAESALTAVLGGLAGLAAAWLLIVVLAGALDLPLTIRSSTVVQSVLASALSGVVAGWYPARRATRLVIVDALRAE
ncbi:MAG: ABC transporter permease [Acidimicrobiia bacterium]